MGGSNLSGSPYYQGYQPVSVFEKDGQYYQAKPKKFTGPQVGANISAKGALSEGPRKESSKGSVSMAPEFVPINFGGGSGGNSSGGGRYGSARPYGSAQRYTSPNSSYRAPAIYSQPRQPQGGKGGYEAPPPRQRNRVANYYKPNKSGAVAAISRVPSFDPDNPQEDAIKDPKLRKAASELNEQAPPGERLAFINPKEEELLKAVGGSGMTAAGGVPSYKKGDVEAPPPRDYGQETADTLQAQVDLAPQLFASEARFRPQYANLERGIMLENLGLDPNMGLLDAFRQISGAQKDIQYDSTLADIDMIGGLGKEFAQAVRSADPRAEGLRQSIMGQAEEGLATGDQDFSDIAEAQRDRLVDRAGDYQPLIDRASAGLESGQEYDQLVSDAQARREANPFAGLVRDAQEDYESGEGLTALEQRDLDQQVLEGAAARGMEDSTGTIAEQVGHAYLPIVQSATNAEMHYRKPWVSQMRMTAQPHLTTHKHSEWAKTMIAEWNRIMLVRCQADSD
jgi:hypothetical protein